MKTIAAFLASAVLASAIQINYYSDGGCDDFVVSPPNVPVGGGCYNWQYSNTNSANIANCNYAECECIFFTQPNCQGPSQNTISPAGPNCASNWGAGFVSFLCYAS